MNEIFTHYYNDPCPWPPYESLVPLFDDPVYVPSPKKEITLTIVLDIDHTLVHVDTNTNLVYENLYLQEVLTFFKTQNTIEVGLWTAGTVEHARRISYLLDPKGTLFKFAIGRGLGWYEPLIHDIPCKDLSKLANRRSIIIDDSPYIGVRNYKTSTICIRPFTVKGLIPTISPPTFPYVKVLDPSGILKQAGLSLLLASCLAVSYNDQFQCCFFKNSQQTFSFGFLGRKCSVITLENFEVKHLEADIESLQRQQFQGEKLIIASRLRITQARKQHLQKMIVHCYRKFKNRKELRMVFQQSKDWSILFQNIKRHENRVIKKTQNHLIGLKNLTTMAVKILNYV
jgi:hypothetical protein